MGVSIDCHVYNRSQLIVDIHKFVIDNGGYREGALPAAEFLEKVGNEYGLLEGGKFFVVWNDYYEEYNPAIQFLHGVERYYFPDTDEDDYDFWSSNYSTIDGGVEDVLDSVFPDEFGYEGKFSDYE